MIPAGLCLPKHDTKKQVCNHTDPKRCPICNPPAVPVNTKADWMEAVADGKTTLGFDAWMQVQKRALSDLKKQLK